MGGSGSHSRFPGFVHIPFTGSWWTGTPPNLQDGGRCRIRPWRNTEYVPGRQFAIFIQVSNRGRFCQYISLPTKYTISDSTLQYKLGLTLSFLSLISRGVGTIQNYSRTPLRYTLAFLIPNHNITNRESKLSETPTISYLYCTVY